MQNFFQLIECIPENIVASVKLGGLKEGKQWITNSCATEINGFNYNNGNKNLQKKDDIGLNGELVKCLELSRELTKTHLGLSYEGQTYTSLSFVTIIYLTKLIISAPIRPYYCNWHECINLNAGKFPTSCLVKKKNMLAENEK